LLLSIAKVKIRYRWTLHEIWKRYLHFSWRRSQWCTNDHVGTYWNWYQRYGRYIGGLISRFCYQWIPEFKETATCSWKMGLQMNFLDGLLLLLQKHCACFVRNLLCILQRIFRTNSFHGLATYTLQLSIYLICMYFYLFSWTRRN